MGGVIEMGSTWREMGRLVDCGPAGVITNIQRRTSRARLVGRHLKKGQLWECARSEGIAS